jgi:sterol desaturase/sphingolipid hydroxylase (fatty acid hydroxylase superfamily)
MPITPPLHELLGVCASGVCFVLACALIFWPLEELFEGEGTARPKLKDLATLWFYQSFGLWIAAGIIYEIAFFLRQFLPQAWLMFVKHQPFWLQATAALLMAEIWVYVFHRLAHTLPCLWKYHRVHHTVVDMTWSAASRQHPVDFLLIIVGANLPAMILGIDLKPIVLLVILERIYTVLLHSDLDIDYGWFSMVIASPKLHRLHHTPKCGNGNYAGLLSLLDVLGHSFKAPEPTRNASKTRDIVPSSGQGDVRQV